MNNLTQPFSIQPTGEATGFIAAPGDKVNPIASLIDRGVKHGTLRP